MGAHPISGSLVWMLALVVFAGCASEDLTTLNPSVAVCRGPDGAACGVSFELGALAVGRTHEQTLYIRNVGAGYLDIRAISLMDAPGQILEYPESLVTGESGRLQFEVAVTSGMQSFQMLIESNDPTTPQLVVEFTYDGVQSDLVACPVTDGTILDTLCSSQLSVVLGDVRRAEAREVSVAIMNRGTASFYLANVEMDFTQSVQGEWTSLTSTAVGEMPADRVYLLTFRYQPEDAVGDSLHLNLYEEDHAEPTVVVDLEAASFANEPPVAIASVYESADELHTVLMGTEVWLDGLASFDPEGDELIYTWNLLNAPLGSVASFSHSTSALTAITLDERGPYELQLVVQDSLGQQSATTLHIDARSEFALEVQASWPIGMGDVDLHMVPVGDPLFGSTDCHFQNGTADWGVQGETLDDPYLMYDTQGIDFSDESVVLEEPANGLYNIYVHYFEAHSSSAIPVTISIWGEDGETLLGESTAALAQPCDTVLVGTLSWPSGLFEVGEPASFTYCFPGGDQ